MEKNRALRASALFTGLFINGMIGSVIKDDKYLRQWEDELIRREPPDYEAKLKIFESMLEHAKAMGAWPPADPMEGIEKDIELARVLNAELPD